MKKVKKTLLSITLILILATAFGLNTFASEEDDLIGLGCIAPTIEATQINHIR